MAAAAVLRGLLRLCAVGAALLATPACGSGGGDSPVFPNAGQCAFWLTEAIDSIVNAGYDIAQAASDCTIPGLSEISCASDLTDMMSYWFGLSTNICALTLACGNLDNACGMVVTEGLVGIGDMSNNLVAASSDCIADPFICTFDVVTAVDKMNEFVSSVIAALQVCEQRSSEPPPGDLMFWATYDMQTFNNDHKHHRRLSPRRPQQELRGRAADAAAARAPETAVAELRLGLARLEDAGASARAAAAATPAAGAGAGAAS